MPEETDKYIRIPVAECDITATIVISKDEGIKALYCGKDKKIATYLFEKDKGWTMTKAKKWVKDHKNDRAIAEQLNELFASMVEKSPEFKEGMERIKEAMTRVSKKLSTEEKTMEKDREERAYKVEMRVEDGDEPKITGHAAVFNKLSVDLMGFKEKVAPGAFTESIEKSDIRALWNHNPDYVLGRNKSGTLKLEEDKKGLAIEISPPDTQWARDLMETIKRGDVDQMSFAFQVIKDSWDERDKKNPIRTLEEVNLFDVSPVTYPAYPQTDVKVRSFLEEAGLDVNRLAVIMESHTATNDEDIAVVKQAIDVLNSYLPAQAEELGDRGAPNEGYVERLKTERWKMEFSK